MDEYKAQTSSAVHAVPLARIRGKLDALMDRKDYAEAERHLCYWLKEAEAGNDRDGKLQIYNELVGFCRKTEQKEKAFQYANQALKMIEQDRSIGAGSTCINVATACSAFGEDEKALMLFRRAEEIYREAPGTPLQLKGGLFNNMAITFQKMGKPEDAITYYRLALETMEQVPGSQPEQAITCLNMADAVEAEAGPEQGEARITELLDRAYGLLRDEQVPRDGYYAFVCEKCAPGFLYHGYFADAQELEEEARQIQEKL